MLNNQGNARSLPLKPPDRRLRISQQRKLYNAQFRSSYALTIDRGQKNSVFS